jgi:hypothetical protein
MMNSNPTTVIPGQPAGLNPESISPSNRMAPWIPGLRLTAHPGMTAENDKQFVRRTP